MGGTVLRVEVVHGREHFSLEEDRGKRESDWRVGQGYRRYLSLSPEQAQWPWPELIALYNSQKSVQASASPELIAQKAKTLEVIVTVLNASHDERELQQARDAYKQVTGKAWVG